MTAGGPMLDELRRLQGALRGELENLADLQTGWDIRALLRERG